jgi:hypothetical protein
MPRYGPSTCISEMNLSIIDVSPRVTYVIMLHILKRLVLRILLVSFIMEPVIQQLPPDFKDFAAKQTAGGKAPSSAFTSHCARDLFHAQWSILLDDEFL